jgi:hypothetical protein
MSGYERTDASIRGVVIFGIVLFTVIALAMFGMGRLFRFLAVREAGPAPSPLALTREIPSLPRLLVNEPADLKELRRTEDALLNSYGWVDQGAGVVRIPIDRAIELLADRGLPARGNPGKQQTK